MIIKINLLDADHVIKEDIQTYIEALHKATKKAPIKDKTNLMVTRVLLESIQDAFPGERQWQQ